MSARALTRLMAFLGGAWAGSSTERYSQVIDPSTGIAFAEVPMCSADDANACVDAARDAFDRGVWSELPSAERRRILMKALEIMTNWQWRLIETEVMESGMTLRQVSFFQLPFALNHFAYLSSLSDRVGVRRAVDISDFQGFESFTVREPMGVVAAITPWNIPLLMAAWKVAPALASGNTVVLKPSSCTPLTSLIMAEALEKAGIPKGVLSVITSPGIEAGRALASNSRVDKISFTGSTEVGREIIRLGAGGIKRFTLELGGKSPNIILPDADLDKATDLALLGVFLHAGQLCESVTRLIVPSDLHDKILAKLVEKASTIKLGRPNDFTTDMGPLITEAQRKKVDMYVESARDEGAKVVCGGNIPKIAELKNGFYYEPTILDRVDNSMKAAREEIFGPVLAVIKYSTEEEAIQMANDTTYGLAAAVWTSNQSRAERVISKLRAGTIWVNDVHTLSVNAPRGGYKQSGFGRELGEDALNEYTELKHVYINKEGVFNEISKSLVMGGAEQET
ncbi:MAG TPA: aldehyde dehydrogenase family protein [Candidatus Bathyarchaeia archaeon]|nr:aldehyde dehydrogenase family protein [Candidatus Bathyarchaeia archaeon]